MLSLGLEPELMILLSELEDGELYCWRLLAMASFFGGGSNYLLSLVVIARLIEFCSLVETKSLRGCAVRFT